MRRPTLGMLKILHRCILSSSGGQEPQLRPLRPYLQTYRDMQRPDNVLRQPRTRTTSNRSSCRRFSHSRPILLKVRILFQRRRGRNISYLARDMKQWPVVAAANIYSAWRPCTDFLYRLPPKGRSRNLQVVG